MREIHTIFGAGQVGLHLARELTQRGVEVRLVRRGAPTATIEGATWIRGDVTDRAFADEAARGATVVYNCANPPDYARWDGVLEPLYRSIWQAAARAGARLVQLDNLYMIGRPAAAPFDESTPTRPCSRKGELRERLALELAEMHDRGDLVATTGRASDFFGPDTPSGAVFRPDVYDRIRAGRTVYAFGDPDMPHTYSYTPDVARGLAVLGAHPEAAGRVWHLPAAAQSTTRELVDAFAHRAGTSVRVRSVPTWVLRAAGALSPLAGALAEMAYQWEVPYLMDDAAFRRAFGVEPTPLERAIDATLDARPAERAAA